MKGVVLFFSSDFFFLNKSWHQPITLRAGTYTNRIAAAVLCLYFPKVEMQQSTGASSWQVFPTEEFPVNGTTEQNHLDSGQNRC